MTGPETSGTRPISYDIVIPSIGRPSLGDLVLALDRSVGPGPTQVVIVDDRRGDLPPLELPPSLLSPRVVAGRGMGPAAARNDGWHACTAPWVVFLDDDVVPDEAWRRQLQRDLARADALTGAVTARIDVPLPTHRRPTDAERGVAGLATSWCITADLAVRRVALTAIGGFDERFTRAYREDTDLALRILGDGWAIAEGERRTVHPTRTATWTSSIRAQRGNADNALMRRLHGPRWRRDGRAPRGMLRRHVVTTSAAITAVLAVVVGARRMAIASATGTIMLLGQLCWSRIRPGPRSVGEIGRMVSSSMLIPFAATWWRMVGEWRARRLAPQRTRDQWRPPRPRAVLFDRDGTLIDDVAYNGDPDRVTPVDGARPAIDRLRSAGIVTGIITNQSGVARGLLDRERVDAVNARVSELLGPFATIEVCEHGPDVGCRCRKPAPGMVLDAAATLGVAPHECVVIGDIGADVEAATNAGARGILVPTSVTLREEIDAAPETAASLAEAVDRLLDGRPLPSGRGSATARVGRGSCR